MTGVTRLFSSHPSFSVLRPGVTAGVRVVMFPSSTGDVTERITYDESVRENRSATHRNGTATVVSRQPRSDRRLGVRSPVARCVFLASGAARSERIAYVGQRAGARFGAIRRRSDDMSDPRNGEAGVHAKGPVWRGLTPLLTHGGECELYDLVAVHRCPVRHPCVG
jgi:hypothetical protein